MTNSSFFQKVIRSTKKYKYINWDGLQFKCQKLPIRYVHKNISLFFTAQCSIHNVLLDTFHFCLHFFMRKTGVKLIAVKYIKIVAGGASLGYNVTAYQSRHLQLRIPQTLPNGKQTANNCFTLAKVAKFESDKVLKYYHLAYLCFHTAILSKK